MRVQTIYVRGICRPWLLANQDRVKRAAAKVENGDVVAMCLTVEQDDRGALVEVFATFLAKVQNETHKFDTRTMQAGGITVELEPAGALDLALMERLGLAA